MTYNCRTACNPCRCGTAEGETRKADALATLVERRAVYVRRGQRALLTALLAGGSATADDVRDAVDLPRGIDPVCLGAVPTALARARIIYRDGYAPTSRPTAHARPVSLWRLSDRNKALRWLADHPELPDGDDDEADDEADEQGLLFPIRPEGDPGVPAIAPTPAEGGGLAP